MAFPDLLTPALMLEESRLLANAQRMAGRARQLGVTLRAHMKTAKCVDVARRLPGDGMAAIAVTTVTETRAFFEAGVRDIRFTAPFAPDRLSMIAPMIAEGLRFQVLIDNAESATRLAQAAEALDAPIGAVMELDVDGYRGGCRPDGPGFDALMAALDRASHLQLDGVYSYGGKTYGLPDLGERQALVERHRETLVNTAERLRREGRTLRSVGMGGSPPLTSATRLDGLTEACAGVFLFQDLAQRGVGVARLEDIAVSVLATIVQRAPDSGRVYIDAGALALAQDRSTARQQEDQGYGLVCDAQSLAPLGEGDLIVAAVSQEHGLIERRGGGPAPAELLPIGARVRVMPNHVCMTANAHAGYHVVREGRVADYWPRANGWNA